MYFAQLTLTPDEATASRAAALAAEAQHELGGRGLDALTAIFEQLRVRFEQGALDADEVQRCAQRYGSLLGELVRERAGGTWGTGLLFGEPVPAGLALGPKRIKFWPWIEARARIEGRMVQPLEERVAGLARAKASKAGAEPSRLYALKADQGSFDAGVTRDGRQAVMAAFYTGTFAIFFDAAGAFLEYVNRPTKSHAPDPAALGAWQAELGFTPRTIRVRRFSVPDAGVGIADLPSHFDDFLDDPDSEPDPDERAELARSIVEWAESGAFVLYWGNDLWLDGDGSVTSS